MYITILSLLGMWYMFLYLEVNKVSIYFPVRSDDLIKTDATRRTVDSDQLTW